MTIWRIAQISLSVVALALVLTRPPAVYGQERAADSPSEYLSGASYVMHDALSRLNNGGAFSSVASDFANDDEAEQNVSRGFRTRQAVLMSGAALGMITYGIFVLRFNNSRTDAENARLAYERDVSENAQFYVDEGIELDQIPTYFAWEEAFTDAANDRELLTLAGVAAFLFSFGAILDSATHHGSTASSLEIGGVRPLIHVSPLRHDVLIGAGVGW